MCSKTPKQTIEAHKENNFITPNENTIKTTMKTPLKRTKKKKRKKKERKKQH